MYDTQQIDVLELIIHTLTEHETKLDQLIQRLEKQTHPQPTTPKQQIN